MTGARERARGMKVIDVLAFVLQTRRAVMMRQLDGTVVKDRVDTGGLDTYYEVHGAGEPLLYLHGGFNTIEMLGEILPVLARRYRVYLPERQGQGRTPDRDGPITYQSMADDTIAFFQAVGLPAAHLAGFSDGAMVAIHVALQRPDLVRKLVLIGQYANPDGCPPFYRELMEKFTPDTFPPMFRQVYDSLSPDGPEHFPAFFNKLKPNWLSPGIPLERLADVHSQALVLIGDDDCVTPEHAAAMVRAFPAGSQLGVVPGTSHGLPFEKPALVNQLILDFLTDRQAEKMISGLTMVDLDNTCCNLRRRSDRTTAGLGWRR
jgi:pimeloyl-ACP methyl ester carboxylesterase